MVEIALRRKERLVERKMSIYRSVSNEFRQSAKGFFESFFFFFPFVSFFGFRFSPFF